MRSDIPSFHEPGSEEDDARWEAYRALLRRNARHPDAPNAESEDKGLVFEPAEDEASMDDAAPAKPGGGDVGAGADEADAGAPFDDLVLDRIRPPALPPRRSRRLVVGVMAVTAGLILALALVPRQPSERVVVLRSRAQVSSGDQAAQPQSIQAEPLAETATSPAPAATDRSARATRVASARADRRAALDFQARTAAAIALARHPAARGDASVPPAPKGSLDCWLTAMNNDHGAGYADGGISVCGGPAPGQAQARPPDNP
jgi:hypothetical protein